MGESDVITVPFLVNETGLPKGDQKKQRAFYLVL